MRSERTQSHTESLADLHNVGAQAQQLDPDDPTAGYMLQAGARLCKCLGEEFLPYLDTVMPALLHSAQLKPDVDIADAEGAEDDDDDDEDGEVRQTKPNLAVAVSSDN